MCPPLFTPGAFFSQTRVDGVVGGCGVHIGETWIITRILPRFERKLQTLVLPRFVRKRSHVVHRDCWELGAFAP